MKQVTDKHRTTPDGDLVLQEMWTINDQLSASYGHSVDRLFDKTRENQIKSGRTSINLTRHRKVT